ncbi:MAG: hypothetical protein AAF532_13110 [Planctomycetota bacterium]
MHRDLLTAATLAATLTAGAPAADAGLIARLFSPNHARVTRPVTRTVTPSRPTTARRTVTTSTRTTSINDGGFPGYDLHDETRLVSAGNFGRS